jgi:predicted polyphosphate/ATP-dependent NAD kinase
MLSTVGIIANPASGKDIRRLVAHGSVFDNQEKVNILRRMLLALDAVGVRRAVFMPDYYGLGERALDGLKLSLEGTFLEMPVRADDRDSTEAARRFREMEVGCIITLGGDGTNRAVAKGCGTVPLVAVSTGTNNVFPSMVEGTVAGLAAGLVATGAVDVAKVTYTGKRLEVLLDGELVDIALVDVVVCADLFIGSRALWDPARIREIVLASAQPGSIGMSAVGSFLHPFDVREAVGMYVKLGDGGNPVLAPVAPGLIVPVPVRDFHLLALGEEVAMDSDQCTVALDGERYIEVGRNQRLSVRLTNRGPRVVDIDTCMAEAARVGVFRTDRTLNEVPF